MKKYVFPRCDYAAMQSNNGIWLGKVGRFNAARTYFRDARRELNAQQELDPIAKTIQMAQIGRDESFVDTRQAIASGSVGLFDQAM